jgi:hypothetical protein
VNESLPCYANETTSPVVWTAGMINYPSTEAEFKIALLSGPVSVSVSAGNVCFQSYHSGILTCDCPDDAASSNHAITVVGWGDGYWLIRNSWGTEWGEQGYVKFPFSTYPGTCGMYRNAMYPLGVTTSKSTSNAVTTSRSTMVPTSSPAVELLPDPLKSNTLVTLGGGGHLVVMLLAVALY